MGDKDQTTGKLEQKIRELESELAEREKDLSVFRKELHTASARLEKLLQQIDQELTLAKQVQRQLVPTEFPNIPGFEFSTKFVPSPISGGDYFDIFEQEDKFRFSIVLANSSGYTMSSLFLSVLLKLMSQISGRKGASPHDVLKMIGKDLVANIKAGDVANVFYGVIDRRRFELTYSSLGDVICLIHRSKNGELERLESNPKPYSSDYKEKPTSRKVSLRSRDRLVLCTEGVSRAQNPQGDTFGEERLYKAILGATKGTVHDLRNEIMFQVQRFNQSNVLPQDITVLVVEVKDRVIKLAESDDE